MSTLVAQTISNGTVSTSTANVINGAKAWVNFNGISGASIRASYNVSSVTRSGTGLYQVNFTNAFADGSYSAVGGGTRASDVQSDAWGIMTYDYQTTYVKVSTYVPANFYTDSFRVNLAIFR